MITGDIENRTVYIDGVELSPARSLELINHSPDGFMWGYGGSGPSQLALALMIEFCEDEAVAAQVYQDFKWDVIARLDKDRDFALDPEDIRTWIWAKRLPAKIANARSEYNV
jgi:hypothetical protein